MSVEFAPSRTAAVRELPAPGLSVLALQAAEQDVLVVLGEADIATAQLLYDQLLRALPAPPRPVLVELGALAFCDLHGMDALRDVARAAASAGTALSFRGASERLQWLHRTFPALRCRRTRRPPALLGLTVTTAGASC